MIDQSLAHPAPTTTREQRGLALYREHADAIRFDVAERVWLVPSQHDATSVYEVRLGRRESCECFDYGRRQGSCKHVYAATIARAKTARCDGCGERLPMSGLLEVGPEHVAHGHEAQEGQRYCRPCAGRAGVV